MGGPLRRPPPERFLAHLTPALVSLRWRGLRPHPVAARLLPHLAGAPLWGHFHPDAVAVHVPSAAKAPLAKAPSPLHHPITEPPRLLLLRVRLRPRLVVAVGPFCTFEAEEQQRRLELERHRPCALHPVLVIRLRRLPQLLGRM